MTHGSEKSFYGFTGWSRVAAVHLLLPAQLFFQSSPASNLADQSCNLESPFATDEHFLHSLLAAHMRT